MRIGTVIIGRNEGERLRRCMDSLGELSSNVVYVDSGSTDGSLELAQSKGTSVVALDTSAPFTAARARNEGFAALRALDRDIEYVQFMDGDCELLPGWLEKAAAFLSSHPEVAAVCGRLRERFPDESVYNLLCDIEWDTQVGEAKACGGNAMMRAAAFEQARGFRADLIAGEEPELCVRLRAAGWRIWRLEAEMALHDAAMTRLGQWLKRGLRAGYAFAEGAYLHGAPPERHWVRESRRAWMWGVAIPLATFAVVGIWGPWGLAMLVIYPLQVIRVALSGRRSARENWLQAVFLVLGKFPEAVGQMRFLYHRLTGMKLSLVEYK